MDVFRYPLSGATAPKDRLCVGIGQIAPVWFDRAATLAKTFEVAQQAAAAGCRLVCFGEALVPGYPFWLEHSEGARFDDPHQKDLFSRYLEQSVVIERGDLEPLQKVARSAGMAIYLGVVEAAPDRGSHSLYCTLVYIDPEGHVASAHRKLQPTYEERLVWAAGDGQGLRVHPLPPFRVGGLNCYENWMPLPRAALYAQGEDLHVAVWPGGDHNTVDITRFIARESRSYVISASSVMAPEHIPNDFPAGDAMRRSGRTSFANGGSAIAGPDGGFVVPPQIGREVLIIAGLDHAIVRRERQNFDVAGHYSRPDVTRLTVDRTRQSTVVFKD
ncbi:carbon-nitrogen hydrolase family protein [Polymorphobacter megasporae]|nr:carbon-nitrogen hydrolase family protein [Polymorphobacter megasporae]UAJ10987.1 carbon-nitrogen hydrolase family protein [Polymorphobacter megasporae]